MYAIMTIATMLIIPVMIIVNMTDSCDYGYELGIIRTSSRIGEPPTSLLVFISSAPKHKPTL